MRIVFAALFLAFTAGLAACQSSAPYDTGYDTSCDSTNTDNTVCPIRSGLGPE